MTLEELEVHMESTNQENVKEYLQKYEYIAKIYEDYIPSKNCENS